MTPAGTPGLTPPDVGLKEAARLSGVSLSTLRRRRDDLRKNGATQHADGTWSIPIHTLISLGMLDGPKPSQTPAIETPRHPQPDALEIENARLREALREAEHRAELAEAIAQERGHALEAERLALRMLTASASTPSDPSPVPGPRVAAEEPTRSSWFRRRRP